MNQLKFTGGGAEEPRGTGIPNIETDDLSWQRLGNIHHFAAVSVTSVHSHMITSGFKRHKQPV